MSRKDDGLDFLSPDESNAPGRSPGWDSTPIKKFQTHGSISVGGQTFSGDIKIVTSGLLLILPRAEPIKIPYSAMARVEDFTKGAFLIKTTDGNIHEVKVFNALAWCEWIKGALQADWDGKF